MGVRYTFISCIYKVYSGIINARIVKYLEDLDWFVDEQGGFRKGRSCQDQIVKYLEDLDWFVDEQGGFRNGRSCQDQMFSLTYIIRNRQAQNLLTFAAFVDMQKTFDWVDRDLLFLKLLIININGKVYNAI